MPDPTPRPSESNGKQSSTTDNLDQEPLGLHHPLLPANPLGQNWLSPKFLTPLGARPIAVINPTIFLKQDIPGYDPFINDFSDIPFLLEQSSLTDEFNSTEHTASPSPISPSISPLPTSSSSLSSPSLPTFPTSPSPPPSLSPPSPSSIQRQPSSPPPRPPISMDRAIPHEEIFLPTHSPGHASSSKTQPADIQRQPSTDDYPHWENDLTFPKNEDVDYLEVSQTTEIHEPSSSGNQASVPLESPQTIEAIAPSPQTSPSPQPPSTPPTIQRRTESTPPQTPKSADKQGAIAPMSPTEVAIELPSSPVQNQQQLHKSDRQTSDALSSNPGIIQRSEAEVDTQASSPLPSSLSSSSSSPLPPSPSSLPSPSSPPSPSSLPSLPTPSSPPSPKHTTPPSIQRREMPSSSNPTLPKISEHMWNSSRQFQQTSDISQTDLSESSLTTSDLVTSSQENSSTYESISLKSDSSLQHHPYIIESQAQHEETNLAADSVNYLEKRSGSPDSVIQPAKQTNKSVDKQPSVQLSQSPSSDIPSSTSPVVQPSVSVESDRATEIRRKPQSNISSLVDLPVEGRSQPSLPQSEAALTNTQPSTSLSSPTDIDIFSSAQSRRDSISEVTPTSNPIQRHPELPSTPIQQRPQSHSIPSVPPIQRHPEALASPAANPIKHDEESTSIQHHPELSWSSSPASSPSPQSPQSPQSSPSPSTSLSPPIQRHLEASPSPTIPTSLKSNSSQQNIQSIISTASEQISAKPMSMPTQDVGTSELETESLIVLDKTSNLSSENATTISPQLETTQFPELPPKKIPSPSNTNPSTSPTSSISSTPTISPPSPTAPQISRSPAELPTVSAPPLSTSYPTALTEPISSFNVSTSHVSEHSLNDTPNELLDGLSALTSGNSPIANPSRNIQRKTAASQDNAIAPSSSPSKRQSISSDAVPSSWSSIAELIGAPSEEGTPELSQPSASNHVQRLVESTPSNHSAVPSVRAPRVNQPASVVDDWLSANEEKREAIAPSIASNSSLGEAVGMAHAIIQDATLESSQANTSSHQTSAGQSSEKTDKLDELAWEIYHLLRQRLQVEQERQGNYYSGRLPY